MPLTSSSYHYLQEVHNQGVLVSVNMNRHGDGAIDYTHMRDTTPGRKTREKLLLYRQETDHR